MHNILQQKNGSEKNLDEYDLNRFRRPDTAQNFLQRAVKSAENVLNGQKGYLYLCSDGYYHLSTSELEPGEEITFKRNGEKYRTTVKELATTVNDEPQSIHENYTRYGEQGNRGENFAKPLQENEVRDFDLRGFLLKENRTMVAQKRAKLLKEGREI